MLLKSNPAPDAAALKALKIACMNNAPTKRRQLISIYDKTITDLRTLRARIIADIKKRSAP